MNITQYKSVPLTTLINRDVEGVVGAVRILFLPMFGDEISCGFLNSFVQRKTVNYKTDTHVVVVGGGVGKLSEFKVPCALDTRRMPPLKRYIELGLLTKDFKRGPSYGRLEVAYRHIMLIYHALKWCSGDIFEIARCSDLTTSEAKDTLAILRTLYPSLVEVYRDVPFEEKLGGAGRLIRREDYWADLYYAVETGRVMPGERYWKPAYSWPKKIRSYATQYSIPPILDSVDFRDGVVADVGCGYGTKGAYGIRRGARHVVLIDIDEWVLRRRGNGLLIDKVVADAHMLPLRNKCIDVSIFWNVFPFLNDEKKALDEIKRITRREVVLSVYNAASAYRHYNYFNFLEVILQLGRPKVIKRYGRHQFQAVVRYADKNT